MRLNTLHLTNFRQHADTRIEFDLGLTGIIGPNGAGKSTVLEAIAWALYGQSAVRGTRDSIRNVRAGPRAPVRVELDFDLAGHRYRVIRGLSNAELYLDGGSEPVATTITDVSDMMTRRLGMTRAEFFHTYFTGQKELAVMAAMPPAERAQFLSRVLGYDRIRAAQGLAREQRKLTSAELTGVKAAMPDPQQVEVMLKDSAARRADAERRRRVATRAQQKAEAALADLTPKWEAAQRARDEHQQAQADLRLAQQVAEAQEREAARIERELAAIMEARTELESIAAQLLPLNEMMDEFRMLDALHREEGRRKTLAEALRAAGDELNELRTRQAALAAAAASQEEHAGLLRARTTELEALTATVETRRTEWVRDRQEAITKRDALRLQYQDVKSHRDRIVDLGEDGICPTCQRKLGDHFRAVHDNLDEQLETITVDGRYFTTRLEQLERMEGEFRELDEQRKTIQQAVTDLERALARSQAAAQELAQLGSVVAQKEQRRDQLALELRGIPSGFDERRHAELERDLDRLSPLNEQATRLSARVDREPALRTEQEGVVARLAEARQRVSAATARVEQTKFSEDELQRQRQQHEGAVAAMRRAELELQAAILDEGGAAEAVATAERARQELERARELQSKLEAERRVHDELDRAYSDLRNDLNLQLRPELSDLAADFLDVLTDGRYAELEIDDDYNVVMLEAGIPKPVISGGEEDLLNLVLRLAISQMIADRSGQTFALLVLDEIFGSLDVDRRLRVVGLLRRLLNRFEQIIVLTHIEDTRDDMDHKIRIDLDDRTGHSVVRQEDIDMVPDYDELRAEVLAAGAD
ncbi:MAG TPA: SMC family ATPase [Gemmatimonadaceae bacterium]